MMRSGELVIGDHNFQAHHRPLVNGVRVRGGGVPRDYSTHPEGHYKAIPKWAVDMPTYPQSEWSDRLKDMVAEKSQCSDLRLTGNNGASIPSRDQNGKGYCWAHSGTSAHLVVRAAMGLPYVSLSAYGIACIIKSYADEGGWGAQGVDFQTSRGVPSDTVWPQQSMSRSNDNPKTWEDAARHKIVEGWVDLSAAQYDRSLTFAQVATCLLSRQPVVVDYNWWSHSVCAIDLIDGSTTRDSMRSESGKMMSLRAFEVAWGMNNPVTGGFGVRIWNSWGDSWSDRGMGVLTSDKSVPDGAVGLRTVLASAA